MIATEERPVELPVESTELSEREISNGRLLRLADFLDELPATRFWFSQWGTRLKLNLDCQSKGCAVGWASTMPEFAALGLQLESDGLYPLISPVVLSPSGERLASMFEAPALIFGLSEKEARFLFEPRDQGSGLGKLLPTATPKAVAAHIREFVAERQL